MTGRDHSLGDGWTPVEAVLAAARARGVFLMVWTPDDLAADREVLVTLSPDRVWAISRSRCDLRGWLAVRIAPDGGDVTGTVCRLGPRDATGDGLLDRLLDADVRVHEPPVLTAQQT